MTFIRSVLDCTIVHNDPVGKIDLKSCKTLKFMTLCIHKKFARVTTLSEKVFVSIKHHCTRISKLGRPRLNHRDEIKWRVDFFSSDILTFGVFHTRPRLNYRHEI